MNAPASILSAATDAKTGGVIHVCYCTECALQVGQSMALITYIYSVRRSGVNSSHARLKPSLCVEHFAQRNGERVAL